MKIALIQTDIAWNQPEANIIKCTELAQSAVESGAEMLIFPEMFNCGFSKPLGELAQHCYETGSRFLSDIAARYNICAIASLPEPTPDQGTFNTSLIYKDAGKVEKYRKMHLFSYGDESSTYRAGDTLLTTTFRGLRCSIFICYDLRFTAPFYSLAQQTDLFIVVANWPKGRREHWLTLLRARAIENQAYVAGVNRVGSDPELTYVGDSVLFSPDGSQLTQLTDQESVIIGEVDPGVVSEWRNTFPALRDRRPALYNFNS